MTSASVLPDAVHRVPPITYGQGPPAWTGVRARLPIARDTRQGCCREGSETTQPLPRAARHPDLRDDASAAQAVTTVFAKAMDEADFRVAVIGTGPAARADAISCAAWCAEQGHDDAAKIANK
jgi:hypothetical protein